MKEILYKIITAFILIPDRKNTLELYIQNDIPP